jgi:hypothetical protein
MSLSFDHFKRLLGTIPKIHEDSPSPAQVYDYYYNRSQRQDVELFIHDRYEPQIAALADRQDKYNALYAKYKEMAALLQQLYNLSHT